MYRIFQSTLPARGATGCGLRLSCGGAFQSTLPARGATCPCSRQRADRYNFNPRSLHGERPFSCPSARAYSNFNPRSLHGERRCRARRRAPRCRISIHAPCTGSDAALVPCAVCQAFQSTLPARGATARARARRRTFSFQSTLPARGATRHLRKSAPVSPGFQSTLPARGATDYMMHPRRSAKVFQSTLPARGATQLIICLNDRRINFNPRSLHGERPKGGLGGA